MEEVKKKYKGELNYKYGLDFSKQDKSKTVQFVILTREELDEVKHAERKRTLEEVLKLKERILNLARRTVPLFKAKSRVNG